MITPLLRNAIFASLLGHLTVFSFFSFSFGARMPQADFSPVSFWGQCLSNSQVRPFITPTGKPSRVLPLSRKPDTAALDKKANESLSLAYHLKPAVAPQLIPEKAAYVDKPATFTMPQRRTEASVMLHPVLPYSFRLYFKDRPVAHVELMFNLIGPGEKKSLYLKRRISSGNLEADLLTMRYISHYLFIQQGSFAPESWQPVKIDLSEKND